jgi:hypothetical protein
VLDGKTGITVPPEDSDRLAEGILLLLRDPELRRILGQSGRQWVLDHFSVEQQIRQTEQLYLEAFAQKVTKRSNKEMSAETREPLPPQGAFEPEEYLEKRKLG